MILREGSLEFYFSDAINCFKFDETDKNSHYYHGLSHCMKAVDFIVELEKDYLLVEVKDFYSPDEYEESDKFNTLANILKEKFRDTFLYRYAENKIDKPVHYLCLVNLDNALVSSLMKKIKIIVPQGIRSNRWERPLVKSCIVANTERWNSRFPKWKITRV
ncbi:MAG: hypothetical protein ACQEQS_10885 [Thermodesulfobacteriota bacterium]